MDFSSYGSSHASDLAKARAWVNTRRFDKLNTNKLEPHDTSVLLAQTEPHDTSALSSRLEDKLTRGSFDSYTLRHGLCFL